MGFYDEMADMAQELLLPDEEGGLGQGVVQLKRLTQGVATEPGEPAGTISTQLYTLRAAVKRVHRRYENGVLVIETGDIVTFAVPETVPEITDKLVIDGAERVITGLTPIAGAGTTVVWKAWCAA